MGGTTDGAEGIAECQRLHHVAGEKSANTDIKRALKVLTLTTQFRNKIKRWLMNLSNNPWANRLISQFTVTDDDNSNYYGGCQERFRNSPPPSFGLARASVI